MFENLNNMIEKIQEKISPTIFWELALLSMIGLTLCLYPMISAFGTYGTWFSLFAVLNIFFLPLILSLEAYIKNIS